MNRRIPSLAMHSTLRSLLPLVFLASLFSSTLSAQQTSNNSSSCPCTLHGTLVDSVTGQPIHGALVSANGGTAPPTLTNSDGKFQFDGLPAGTVNVQATKPGYSTHDGFPRGLPPTFPVTVGPETPAATIKLTPEGVIYGKVTDENGQPLEGFNVWLLRRSPVGGQFFHDPPSRAVTDDEGNYRIADLARGSCYVAVNETQAPVLTTQKNSAVPQGYAPAFYPGVSDLTTATLIKVLPGKSVQANFSLKREPFAHISGTVTGYNSQVPVQLTLEGPTGEQLPAEISFDALTGAFQSKWIPPGSYTLNAQTAPGQSSAPSPTFSIASQPLNITSDISGIHLALQPAINIPVHINGDFSGSTPQNTSPPFALALFPTDHGSHRAFQYSTFVRSDLDSPGSLSLILQNVWPGAYSVQIMSTGPYYVESATWGSTDLLHDDLVIGASGSVPPIELTIRQGVASISGSVVSGEQPSSAVVVIIAAAPRLIPKFIPTDERGNFSMPSLAPGTYRVIAVDDLMAFEYENPEVLAKFSSFIQEVTLTEKQAVSLRLELARVGD